jgi:hypothetical protein
MTPPNNSPEPPPIAALVPGSSKVFPQGSATPFIGPNPTVNGLVAHHGLPLKLAPPHNLFGAKSLTNQRLNRPKFRRSIPPVPTGSSFSSARFLDRMTGAIAAIMHRPIPLHLPVQRATMPTKMFRHRCHPHMLLSHCAKLITFLTA